MNVFCVREGHEFSDLGAECFDLNVVSPKIMLESNPQGESVKGLD